MRKGHTFPENIVLFVPQTQAFLLLHCTMDGTSVFCGFDGLQLLYSWARSNRCILLQKRHCSAIMMLVDATALRRVHIKISSRSSTIVAAMHYSYPFSECLHQSMQTCRAPHEMLQGCTQPYVAHIRARQQVHNA